ncbi:MAG: hypothetical protein FWH41_07885 [Treponema sp.]|nr:hypothetical protein [Treponema sp.]
MGGRGAMMNRKPSERIQENKTADYIAGVKVLKRLKGKQNLPAMSNTPNTSYIQLTSKGEFKQYKVYGYDRRPIFDIDGDHPHGKIKGLHIHFWAGGRDNNVRELTLKEKKKYGKILRAAGGKLDYRRKK